MRQEAFDSATGERRVLTDTPLGREFGRIVRSRLEANFRAGDYVLELNCGTGNDAVWLAEHGVRVVATESSPGMLEIARARAMACGAAERIQLRHLDVLDPVRFPTDVLFDGVISDVGRLGSLRDLEFLATKIRESLRPGGRLLFVGVGMWCVWEILWHLVHLKPRSSSRRLRSGSPGSAPGCDDVRVWHPSVRDIRTAFDPDFELKRITGLGVFLPPACLESGIATRPRVIGLLGAVERALASHWIFNRLGDHCILEFERSTPPGAVMHEPEYRGASSGALLAGHP